MPLFWVAHKNKPQFNKVSEHEEMMKHNEGREKIKNLA